jgi:hypothetical protein
MIDNQGSDLEAVAEGTTALDLAAELKRAKLEQAERTGVAHDLLVAAHARLETLRDALAPVLAAIPREADVFDHGLVPGEKSRFYVDMIAFVEMSRDRRTYRFLMDTAQGRKLLGESDDVATMASAVTRYIARRIVERDSALAQSLVFDAPDAIESHKPMELDVPSASIATMPVITEVRRPDSGRTFGIFVLGLLVGAAAYAAWLNWDNAILPLLTRVITAVTQGR